MLLSPHAVNPFVMKKLPYDSVKDFQPITLVAIVPGLMTMHPGVPAKNLKDIIALAKAKPDRSTTARPRPMTSGHLSMELLNLMMGIKITHIPYKGGAPAMAAVMAGESHMMISGPATVQANVKAGKLKAIAVTTAKRSPGMPDVPTFQESGVPGFDTYEWYGMFAPAGISEGDAGQAQSRYRRGGEHPGDQRAHERHGLHSDDQFAAEFAAFVEERDGEVGQAGEESEPAAELKNAIAVGRFGSPGADNFGTP